MIENRPQSVGADLSAKGAVHSAEVLRLKVSLRGQTERRPVHAYGLKAGFSQWGGKVLKRALLAPCFREQADAHAEMGMIAG